MIYQESTVNILELPKKSYFHDWRFQTLALANKLHVQKKMPFPCPYGRFPFREITKKVVLGNPTIGELSKWYKYAHRSLLENNN